VSTQFEPERWVGVESFHEVVGPIETILWLAVLEHAGSLSRCIACQSSTVWRHPRHGGVHPQCVPRAMAAMADDTGGDALVVKPGAPRRRGAYSRRGAV
jgi:hypothetical protein